MLRLFLILWVLTAGCWAEKSEESAEETVGSSTGRPRLRFFSGAGVQARSNFGSFRAEGFNRPLSLRPIPIVRKSTEAPTEGTTTVQTTTTEPVYTSTTLAPEPSFKAAAEARLRPEEELSASIQGQVLQSLYAAGREPERIPRPVQKQQATSKPAAADPPSVERQPPSPAKQGTARRIRLLSPANLRPNILDRRQPLPAEEQLESDVDTKQDRLQGSKTSAAENELGGSNEPKEVKRIDLRKLARERYAVTKPKLSSTTDATTTTTTLTTTTTRAPTTTTRAPTTTTTAPATTEPAVTSKPGPRSFFYNAPTGSVRVIPIPSPLSESPPKDMVDLDGIQVPKFSKMVKNMGLQLLHRDESSRPVDELVNTVLRDEAAAQPAVQGFRVKGDSTNRIIFLNLAELGLEAGTAFKLGDKELVPVRGLTSFSDTVETGREVLGSVMNKDAVNKMLATHLQHSQAIHEPVQLPNALALPRGGNQQPLSSRNSRLPVFQANVDLAPKNRQQKTRKQPVQFFDRFDGQPLQAGPEYRQPVASIPSPARSESPSRSSSKSSFSSFPARQGSNLPSSAPTKEGRGDGQLAREPKQLGGEFGNFLDSVYEQTELVEEARQEQARFSPSQNTQRQGSSFQQPLLQTVQVPGLETVRAQEAALRALQQQQTDSLRAAQPQHHQQANHQPFEHHEADSLRAQQPLAARPTYTRPVPALTQSKVRVPGLDAVLAQQAALRAVQEQHAARNIQADVQHRFEVPQQVHHPRVDQHLPHANQHHSRANQQPAIPGLAQHARYVAELRVAQDALNSLN